MGSPQESPRPKSRLRKIAEIPIVQTFAGLLAGCGVVYLGGKGASDTYLEAAQRYPPLKSPAQLDQARTSLVDTLRSTEGTIFEWKSGPSSGPPQRLVVVQPSNSSASQLLEEHNELEKRVAKQEEDRINYLRQLNDSPVFTHPAGITVTRFQKDWASIWAGLALAAASALRAYTRK